MTSHFTALRVRPADCTITRATDGSLPECWLLIEEWPPGKDEPTYYWLSTMPASSRAVVR